MPSRNTTKIYDSRAFYHVYNRGAGEQKVFMDAADKRYFINLFRRHLLDHEEYSEYAKYDVEIAAYCLMGNHFHLLLWQGDDPAAITGLMRSVSTAYAMYFNRRHKRQGHVFQSIYRASHITNDQYFVHISRYIHLNPERYRTYYWSSLREYLGERDDELIHPERVLDMSPERYLESLDDYTDRRAILKEIQQQLADK